MWKIVFFVLIRLHIVSFDWLETWLNLPLQIRLSPCLALFFLPTAHLIRSIFLSSFICVHLRLSYFGSACIVLIWWTIAVLENLLDALPLMFLLVHDVIYFQHNALSLFQAFLISSSYCIKTLKRFAWQAHL